MKDSVAMYLEHNPWQETGKVTLHFKRCRCMPNEKCSRPQNSINPDTAISASSSIQASYDTSAGSSIPTTRLLCGRLRCEGEHCNSCCSGSICRMHASSNCTIALLCWYAMSDCRFCSSTSQWHALQVHKLQVNTSLTLKSVIARYATHIGAGSAVQSVT